MDPVTISALFLIFIATEKVVGYAGGKIANSFSKPIWESLEEKAKALAGTDETSKRYRDFVKAFTEAKEKFLKDARDPETAKILLDVLETLGDYTKENNAWLIPLSDELEKLSLVDEKPDEEALVKLCLAALEKKGVKPPKRADLADAARDFLLLQRQRMFAKTSYRQLMKDQAVWEKLQQRYDTRERYIAQVIKHYQDLDFVGIPELKDRQALRIEDVFIALKAEEEEKHPFKKISREEAEKLWSSVTLADDERNKREYLASQTGKVLRRLSINQSLAENLKLAVLGDPGSGKTTLLKYIAMAFAENQPERLGLQETRLPIFIRLYDYVAKRSECNSDGFSFVDYLDKFACDHLQLNLAPTFFAEALERGDCCVCLDGLDELGAAGLRREVTAAVAALANRYQRNRFIVTSRIVGYEEAPLDRREFVHQTVQPLSDDDIKLFVEKWYKAREKDPVVRKERTEHLTKTIMEQERIKSLATNPLMLTIIALVHRIEAELPHERVKLYDKCVTTLVETWDKVRGMKYSLRRRLLEKLAYWMHTQPGENGRTREVREGNLELQLRHFLETDPKLQLDEDQVQHEVAEFLNLTKTRSGLLVERGEGIYTFSHLTFQEFLAACDIEHRLVHSVDAIWTEIQPRLHDAHWREVILLLLGALNRYDFHNSELMRRIYESTDPFEPVLRRHLFLAARALADHVMVDAKLHNEIVDALLSLAASQEFAQWNAFSSLGTLQADTRAAAGLLALARDEKVDAWVCHAAAQALGQLGRADEAAGLLLALARDEEVNEWVRCEAAQALGQLGRADEAVVNGLLALARDEKVDAWVRSAAAQALGQLGRADEAAGLLLALARDEKVDAGVRRVTPQALGQLGRADEAVLNGLLALARDEKVDAWVRHAAAQVLGQLGRADEAVLNGLLALARDEEEGTWVRSAAAQALGQLGRADEAVLNGLLALARDEEVNELVRIDAAQALGQLGRADEAVLNGLLALARDEKVNELVRIDAAQALGQLGRADEAAGLLLALARDEKAIEWVRREAVQALGQLGRADEAVLNGLLALARDEKVDEFAAAQALGQLGRADEAAGLLLALARDEKVEAGGRHAAAQALGQLGRADEAVLNGLLALARDEKVNELVRHAAAQALGQLGRADEAVLNGLLALARDEKVNELMRRAAYDSLKTLLGEVSK